MQRREKTIDPNSFARRHIGPNKDEVRAMLREVGFENLDSLVDAAVPKNIRLNRELNLAASKSEMEALAELRSISRKNKLARSFIGCGYSDCITPPVIQRNILENPGSYTDYTPYQAELAQGRLEALLNFQGATVVNGKPSITDDEEVAQRRELARSKDGFARSQCCRLDSIEHRSIGADFQTVDIQIAG